MHKMIRKLVVNQLDENPQLYSKFVPENYEEYCNHMYFPGEW